MKKLFLLAVFVIFFGVVRSQNYTIKKDDFAHTFSIVARDTVTGEMAVGVQSHWFSVGTSVPWGRSGVGVVATQSFVNPAYGPEGLDLMEGGKNASEALGILIAQDPGKEFRQVAFLDAKGNSAAFTGANCVEAAGDISGKNFSVQANMMLNQDVVPAMEQAFRSNAHLPLAERVLEVLKAAQTAGGDIRGKQSAALIVVGAMKVENPWEDKKIDLRVDDHEEPLVELERLLKVARAYEFMNKGDLALERENIEEALKQYGKAMEMYPDNLEMKYWTAVTLANTGRVEEALPLFKAVFSEDPNWREMTRRLPSSGLLKTSEEDLKTIINLK
ncbi:DUF1028 domain-containing protein [Salinimicrobium soli]|uniref:DUF1028 domain-containing protein n=1 Tax=Salinimicrobium soli TaxID=1254399 RepID=UPI003AB0DFBD